MINDSRAQPDFITPLPFVSVYCYKFKIALATLIFVNAGQVVLSRHSWRVKKVSYKTQEKKSSFYTRQSGH